MIRRLLRVHFRIQGCTILNMPRISVAYHNLNFALEHNQKKYFVIFHDDDMMKPGFLKAEVEYLEKNGDCSIVSCRADRIDISDNVIIPYTGDHDMALSFSGHQLFAAYLAKQQYILFPSVMYQTLLYPKTQYPF